MSVITVVGLGPGDISSLPFGTMRELQSGKPLFFRTFIHPVVNQLQEDGLQADSFDYLYETGESFESIYTEMATVLLRVAAEKGDIVYAVPGHPLMAEQSVQNLLKQSQGTSVEVKIGSGQSFVDAVCTLLQVDPIEGLSILDGTMLDGKQIRPSLHTLVVQVFDKTVASEVKLTLMDVFPDDYQVHVVRAAGVPGEEQHEILLLHELDRTPWIDHLTTVYIPPTAESAVLRKDPWQVVSLVQRLREPGGCPWDQKQTHQTLRPYVIEEAYEVAEAIDNDDEFSLSEELGDLLLQVLLHAQIGSEQGTFDIRDVYAALADKLIRRHPHVFGETAAKSAEEAEQFWYAAKAAESGDTSQRPSVLAKVKWSQPPALTSLSLQKAAAKVGFDWSDITGVLQKVREETEEVAQLTQSPDSDDESKPQFGQTDELKEQQTLELGDLLFTVINLARWMDIDVDYALSLANRKFSSRFLWMEKNIQKNGQSFEKMTAEQLDFYWNQSKAQEKTFGLQQ